jgi:hypothetical protein
MSEYVFYYYYCYYYYYYCRDGTIESRDGEVGRREFGGEGV